MDGLRLYGRYVAVSLKGQAQYPANVLMQTITQFATNVLEFLGILFLFQRFGGVKGWSLGEVALFYGVVSMGFAAADALTRGFEYFGEEFVRTAAFDRVLLRPRSAALQLMGQELRLSRIGRFGQGLAGFLIGASLIHLDVTPAKAAVLAFAVAGAVALFFGVMVLQATLAFWTVESLEIVNTLTYGGVDANQYPLDIYARWFRSFLTFVVPIGCVVYLPVCWVLGRSGATGAPEWLLPLAPLAGFAFLGACLIAWRLGVRHYSSAGG